MGVWIYVSPGDWRPPEGEPAERLVMQAVEVAADSADSQWVQVMGWRMLPVEHEMPRLVTYLVRWNALPAQAQALLVEPANGHRPDSSAKPTGQRR